MDIRNKISFHFLMSMFLSGVLKYICYSITLELAGPNNENRHLLLTLNMAFAQIDYLSSEQTYFVLKWKVLCYFFQTIYRFQINVVLIFFNSSVTREYHK